MMKIDFTRTLNACALLTVTVLTITACGSAGASGPEDSAGALGSVVQQKAFDELYQKALGAGETQVTVYGPPASPEFYEAFTRRFPGIKVTPQQLQGPIRTAKLEAEKSSGNSVGDVATDGQRAIGALSNEGWCDSFDPIMDVDAKWLHMNNTVLDYSSLVFGVLYNTNMVEEKDVPRSWEDLLDPKWKGKMSIADPAGPSVSTAAFASMLVPESNNERYGMSYLQKLKAQEISYAAKSPMVPQSVASGDTALGVLVSGHQYKEAKDKGAPVGFSFPLEAGNVNQPNSVCLLKNAPNPNAAKLYLDWIYSPDGQTVIAETQMLYPIMPGTNQPEGLPPFSDVKGFELLPLEEGITGYDDARKTVVSTFG
jgi:iron(III) transport system substrate-binding protein